MKIKFCYTFLTTYTVTHWRFVSIYVLAISRILINFFLIVDFLFTCTVDRFHVGRTVVGRYAARRGRRTGFAVFRLAALFRFGFYTSGVHGAAAAAAAAGLRRLLLGQSFLFPEFCPAVLKPHLHKKIQQ